VHRLYGDGHDPALSALDPGDTAGLIHLRHHPPAEDVAVGVRLRRHRDRAHGQLAARFGIARHRSPPVPIAPEAF
jgi:hypothetical protein